MKWRRPKKGGRYIAWVRGAFRRQAAKPLRPLVPSSRLRAAGGGIARCGLADNRLAELAGWDDELLALELKDLTDAGFDATLTGFDDSEVAALVASLDEGGGEPEQAEEVPEPPAQAVTQPGDLWLIGPHRLLCGDCRDYDTVMKLFGDRRANVVVTSPPYATQREYDPASGFKADPAGRIRGLVSRCRRKPSSGAGGGRLVLPEH